MGQILALLLLSASLMFNSSAQAEEEISDPIESVNRAIFDANDFLDVNIAEPVAKGYDDIMPTRARRAVGNFFENLGSPSYMVSDLVQLKFGQLAAHTGRFLINSTIGVAGIFDVADEFGLKRHKEDFGVALAYHGIPAGPYLVIPVLGPTNVRDGVGRIVDGFLNPLNLFGLYADVPTRTSNSIVFGGQALFLVNLRADLLEATKAAKESSVDYYLFVQSAYYQYRQGLVYDGMPPDDYEHETEKEELPDGVNLKRKQP